MMNRVTAETVRQLAAAADIRPDEAHVTDLTQALGLLLTSIERCEELGLAAHEPALRFGLSGGAADAEL